MKTIIHDTIRPNGVQITMSSSEDESGRVTYVVKSSRNSHDKRFYGIFNLAVRMFNKMVEAENATDKQINEEL